MPTDKQSIFVPEPRKETARAIGKEWMEHIFEISSTPEIWENAESLSELETLVERAYSPKFPDFITEIEKAEAIYAAWQVVLHVKYLRQVTEKQARVEEIMAKATAMGEDWMAEVLENSELSEWENLTYPEFCQALSNANAPGFPIFAFHAECDTAYDAAWDYLQEVIALFAKEKEENA